MGTSMTNNTDGEAPSEEPIPDAGLHASQQTPSLPSPAESEYVRTVVSSERRSLDVPVSHDELRVERVPLPADATAGVLGPGAFTEKDIDVPVMGEDVELRTRIHMIEEIVLRKRQVTETRAYTGEVRTEHVLVEAPGDPTLDSDDPQARDSANDDTIADGTLPLDEEWPAT
jgi:uncharacterized protein (TIGR02271 family)